MANEGAAGGFIHAAPANNDKLPVVRSIFDFSAEALGELKTWLEQNPPSIPVTQIVGFQTFTVQASPTIATQDTTSSSTYTDLSATVGPQLTGLPNGQYVFLFGAGEAFIDVAGFGARMSIQVNSTAAVNADECLTAGTNTVSIVRAVTKTLSGGNNTVTCKYLADAAAHTATFGARWLIGLKYANA